MPPYLEISSFIGSLLSQTVISLWPSVITLPFLNSPPTCPSPPFTVSSSLSFLSTVGTIGKQNGVCKKCLGSLSSSCFDFVSSSWGSSCSCTLHLWGLCSWCRQQQQPCHPCQGKLPSLWKRLCYSQANRKVLQWKASHRLHW